MAQEEETRGRRRGRNDPPVKEIARGSTYSGIGVVDEGEKR